MSTIPVVSCFVAAALGAQLTSQTLQMCTSFSGLATIGATNDGAGNMFDVTVHDPSGITVLGLGGSYSPGVVAVEVWITPSTYLGRERNVAAWTRVATGSSVASASNTETFFNTNDFGLAPGSYGVLVWATTSGGNSNLYFSYGTNSYVGPDLTIRAGVVMSSRFGGAMSNPEWKWDGCFHYVSGQWPASFGPFGAGGCPGSSGTVATLALAFGALPRAGATIRLDVTGAPPSAPIAGLLIGFATLVPPTSGFDLGAIGGQPGCVLWPLPAVTLPLAIDGAGAGFTYLAISQSTALGLRFYAQGVFADPAIPASLKLVTSDAKTGVVGYQ